MRTDVKSPSGKRALLPALVCVVAILVASLAVAVFQGSGGGSPSASGEEPVIRESEIADALPYPAEKPNRQLRVVISPLPTPDPMEYLRSPEILDYPGNLVSVVADSELGDTEAGQVVGLVYATESRAMFPRQFWGAGLAWIEERQAAYLVVVKAFSWHVTISIYEVDPTRRIGEFPLVLDPRRFKEWPGPDEPVAVTEKTLIGERACGVSSIDVYAEDGQVRIDASRTRTECAASTIGFDIEKEEWTEIE